MKTLLVGALVALTAVPVAFAAPASRTIATNGTTIQLPTGWHAVVARTPSCDPERLIVAASTQLRISSSGQVAAPRPGQVVLFLLEDRYVQDRPAGNLRRPAHFTIAWNKLKRLDGGTCEGLPNAPASMHYFKTHGRYLGFILYPGPNLQIETKLAALAVMNSLRVTPLNHQP